MDGVFAVGGAAGRVRVGPTLRMRRVTRQDDLVGLWREWLVVAGRSDETVKLRVYQLTRFSEDHPELLSCSADDVVAWLAGHDWSASTRHSWRSALAVFYQWAVVTGRVTVSPVAALPAVKVPRRFARPTPEQVVEQAMDRATPRVRLMIELAGRCGLRRGEIALVHSDDLVEDLVGWSLIAHGKGGKDRYVPVPRDVAQRIREAGGWVFPGAIEGHLSARRVGDLIADALPAGWTAHTLRHRFATRTYAAARDLVAVQELLGHAKPETTRLYIETPPDSLRAAVAWAA